MEQRITALERDVSDVKIRLGIAESNIKDIKEDIASINNNTTWLLRIVIGSVILAILGLVLKGGV